MRSPPQAHHPCLGGQMSLGSLGDCLVTGVTSLVAVTAWLRRASRDLAGGSNVVPQICKSANVPRAFLAPGGAAPTRLGYSPVPLCSQLQRGRRRCFLQEREEGQPGHLRMCSARFETKAPPPKHHSHRGDLALRSCDVPLCLSQLQQTKCCTAENTKKQQISSLKGK